MKKLASTIALLAVSLSSFAQWTTISSDPSGDVSGGGLDGTLLEYQYDETQEEVRFRITTTNLSSYSTSPAADFSFQLPNGLASGTAAGTHWSATSTPVHKTAFIYCDAGGTAPSTYTYSSWSQRIEETSSNTVLCSNCVGINVDVSANQITYTFNRTDIITDAEMGGNSATIVLVANLGHNVGWDDNLSTTKSFTISKTVSSTQQIEEASNIMVYPNPVQDVLNIDAKNTASFNTAIISNVLGAEVLHPNLNNEQSVNVSSLEKGVYFLRLYNDQQAVSVLQFIKQ